MTQATAPAATAAQLYSDNLLVRRATQGDRRAFAAIYRRYHQDLYRYCATIVGNPEDAQDALQNTMLKVLGALPGEERPIQLKPWLYKIAHNESVDLLRRRRAESIDAEIELGLGPTEIVEARERLRALIADLKELPERQSGALVMRELGGLSFNQIGAAFETTPAVARQTVYEARLSLQQMSQGREMRCQEVTIALSDGDGRILRRRDLRAHLRSCSDCQDFRDGIASRRNDLASILPLPATTSVALLNGILGSAHGGAGGGAIGTLGAGTAKTLATSGALKSAATIAVVAAVGVSAANRTGLIHIGLPGEHHGKATRTSKPTGPAEKRSSAAATLPAAVGNAASSAHPGALGRSGFLARHRHVSVAKLAGATGLRPHQLPKNGGRSQGHALPQGLPQPASHGQRQAPSHGPLHLPPKARSHTAHQHHLPAHSVKGSSHGSSGGTSEHPVRPVHPIHHAHPHPHPPVRPVHTVHPPVSTVHPITPGADRPPRHRSHSVTYGQNGQSTSGRRPCPQGCPGQRPGRSPGRSSQLAR